MDTLKRLTELLSDAAHNFQDSFLNVDNIRSCLSVAYALGVSTDCNGCAVTASEIREGNLKAILALFFALSRHKQQQKHAHLQGQQQQQLQQFQQQSPLSQRSLQRLHQSAAPVGNTTAAVSQHVIVVPGTAGGGATPGSSGGGANFGGPQGLTEEGIMPNSFSISLNIRNPIHLAKVENSSEFPSKPDKFLNLYAPQVLSPPSFQHTVLETIPPFTVGSDLHRDSPNASLSSSVYSATISMRSPLFRAKHGNNKMTRRIAARSSSGVIGRTYRPAPPVRFSGSVCSGTRHDGLLLFTADQGRKLEGNG
ncbi:hypothetical protein J437_LFUL011878 [Ladona fulva]|uniref:Uncharacterized protein n=1 Tax=Ladona fulva TaxID=123851 RepID=A0A8K0P5A3_LADFU|nr:hypothetical protein J437_LFUL011878 [Ladona fulva]